MKNCIRVAWNGHLAEQSATATMCRDRSTTPGGPLPAEPLESILQQGTLHSKFSRSIGIVDVINARIRPARSTMTHTTLCTYCILGRQERTVSKKHYFHALHAPYVAGLYHWPRKASDVHARTQRDDTPWLHPDRRVRVETHPPGSVLLRSRRLALAQLDLAGHRARDHLPGSYDHSHPSCLVLLRAYCTPDLLENDGASNAVF
jgi:hypothetical protein